MTGPVGRAVSGRPSGHGPYLFFGRSQVWRSAVEDFEGELQAVVRIEMSALDVRPAPLLGVQQRGAWVLAHRFSGVPTGRSDEVAAQWLGPIPGGAMHLADILGLEGWSGFSRELKGAWWSDQGFRYDDVELRELVGVGRADWLHLTNAKARDAARVVAALVDGRSRLVLRCGDREAARGIWDLVRGAIELIPPSLLSWITSFAGWTDRPGEMNLVIVDESLRTASLPPDAAAIEELPEPPEAFVRLVEEAKQAVLADPTVDLHRPWGAPVDGLSWWRAVEQALASGYPAFAVALDPPLVVHRLLSVSDAELAVAIEHALDKQVELAAVIPDLARQASGERRYALRSAAFDVFVGGRFPAASGPLWAMAEGMADPGALELNAQDANDLVSFLEREQRLDLVEDVAGSVAAGRVGSDDPNLLLRLVGLVVSFGGNLAGLVADRGVGDQVVEALVALDVSSTFEREPLVRLLADRRSPLAERVLAEPGTAPIIGYLASGLDANRASQLSPLVSTYLHDFKVSAPLALALGPFDAKPKGAVRDAIFAGADLQIERHVFDELFAPLAPIPEIHTGASRLADRDVAAVVGTGGGVAPVGGPSYLDPIPAGQGPAAATGGRASQAPADVQQGSGNPDGRAGGGSAKRIAAMAVVAVLAVVALLVALKVVGGDDDPPAGTTTTSETVTTTVPATTTTTTVAGSTGGEATGGGAAGPATGPAGP